MLSSDILEQQFGETHIVILRQDTLHRIIKTIAPRNNETLELSLVTFDQHTMAFPDIHQQILDGMSMGKAYTQAGIPFNRKINAIHRDVLPPVLQSHFTSSGPATIIDVDILVGDDTTHYCHILEIYSSSVTWTQIATTPNSQRLVYAMNDFSKLLS